MSKCLYCQDETPEGMMVCPNCLKNLSPSEDYKNFLILNNCFDKEIISKGKDKDE